MGTTCLKQGKVDMRTYFIEDRNTCWKLTLFENNEEAGGGIFPFSGKEEKDEEYMCALDQGEDWII